MISIDDHPRFGIAELGKVKDIETFIEKTGRILDSLSRIMAKTDRQMLRLLGTVTVLVSTGRANLLCTLVNHIVRSVLVPLKMTAGQPKNVLKVGLHQDTQLGTFVLAKWQSILFTGHVSEIQKARAVVF